MSTADKPSLQAIHEQLSAVLEDRVTELMTHLKAAQALARQIARTEEEIDRQRLLSERLTAELAPLRDEAANLAAETESLQATVRGASSNVARLKEIREELRALTSSRAQG